MRPSHHRVSVGVSVFALLGFLACLSGCVPSQAGPTPATTLPVALPRLEQNALIYVAAQREFFARSRLDVVQKDYDTGVASLDALMQGEADLAVAAEYPFLRLALQGAPVTVIATIDRFENDYVVARADRGIAGPADLKGKRIGLPRGTIVEFYLARLLELHHVAPADMTVVDLAPERLGPALAAGEVDAVVAWQPHVRRIEQETETVTFSAQSGQAVFGVLVCRTDWLAANVASAERFLRALADAEAYLLSEPDVARSIVQQRLDYDPDYLAAVWPKHDYSLALAQPLVIAMKDEAQWLIRNGLADAQALPDFGANLDAAALRKVKPGAVGLIP